MEVLLDFIRGPLFRLTFAVMILGLLRNIFLTASNIIQVWLHAGNKTVNWKLVLKRTVQWIFPFGRLFRSRPLYSIMSILFHTGILVVPIFLFAHVELWRKSIGLSLPVLKQQAANFLTIVTIITCAGLFIGRVAFKESRQISRVQDYVWPLLLAIPFISGFLASHPLMVAAVPYNFMLLIHILSAEVIFLLIPFTKIAHSVLLPVSHLVSELSWHFPANSGENVAITLGKEGEPI